VTGLLDALAVDARVTMLSSKLHESAPKDGIQFDNLSGEKSYSAWVAYGQSKPPNFKSRRSLDERGSGLVRP
jgi:hypothetical protein